MTNSEKALYYCNIHTNLFSQQACSNCNRGMCYTCIENHNSVCPECLKGFHQHSSDYQDKKQLLWIVGSGVLASLLSIVYAYFANGQIEVNGYSFKVLAIAFLLGASFTATHYLMGETDFMEKIKSTPFIGMQLGLLVLAFIMFTGSSLIYFAYKMLKARK